MGCLWKKKIRETYKDDVEIKMSAKYPFSRIVSLNYFSAFEFTR